MSKRISWKSKYEEAQKEIENLKGFQSAIETQENKLAGFQQKIISIENMHIIIAIVIALLTAIQIYYIVGQNDLIRNQNDLVSNQNYLMEAERRSSLIFLMSNVLDKVDEEIREQNVSLERTKIIERDRSVEIPERFPYYLSDPLITRIVALSRAFKPYKILENGQLSSNLTSPERGQLFITLMTIGLDSLTQNRIASEGDFSYAKIGSVDLEGANLIKANLAYTDLRGAKLNSAKLNEANLSFANFNVSIEDLEEVKKRKEGWREYGNRTSSSTDFRKAFLFKTNLKGANLAGAYMGFSSFRYANLTGADLTGVNLQSANVQYANFEGCNLSFSSIEDAKLGNANFSKANFNNTYGVKILGSAKSLAQCRNLDAKVENDLLTERPYLFK